MPTPQEFAAAFCEVLNEKIPGWTVDDDQVLGPEGAQVYFGNTHPSQNDGHTDVAFHFGAGPSLWDCATGFGETASFKAYAAAMFWVTTTGCAMLELKYSRKGEFADHFSGDEPSGFTNWHSICSPILGFGDDASKEILLDWLEKQDLLAGLSAAMTDTVGNTGGPHGFKVFFGGQDVAEVRLNGEIHPQASDWLSSLDWPRLDPPCHLRFYVILIHPDVHG